MAIEKEITLKVNDNLEPSIKNLRELKKQLRETAAGTKEFDVISQRIRDMDDAIKDANKTSDDFKGYLENASGPLGMLGKGIRQAEQTFSSWNAVMKASVIGAIVALLGGLAAAFSENEDAQKKLKPITEAMSKIFNGVYRIVEPLFNILVDLATKALPIVAKGFSGVYSAVSAVFESLGSIGKAIYKLITGDFSGAWDEAKKSVTDFGKHYDEANKRFEKGSKELTASEKEELAKRRENEKKHQEELAKQKEVAHKKALEAQKRQKEEEEKQRKLLEEKAKNELNKDNANTDLSVDFGPVQQADAKIQLTKDTNQAILDENAKFELENAQILYDSEESQAQRRREYFQQKIQDFQNTSEAIGSIAKSGEDLLSQLQANGIARGKAGQAASKAFALTQIAVDSAVAFSKMMQGTEQSATGASSVGGPYAPAIYLATKIAFYASGTATILANIARARALLSSSGGGGGGGAVSTPTTSAPAPSFNVVGSSGTNQLAQAIGKQNTQPVEAYVVASNVTSAQSLNRNIVTSATIG